MAQTTEEILRFVVQATGNESLTPIVRSILDLSGNSQEAQTQVAALLTELSDQARLSATLEQYRRVGAGVIQLGKDFDAAKAKVEQLGRELSATEEPTKRQRAEFESARATLAKLGGQYDSQLAKLRGYRTELQAAGLSTTNFAASQRAISQRSAEAASALQRMSDAARAAADEQQRQAAAAAEAAKGLTVAERQALRAAVAQERLARSTADVAQEQEQAAAKTGILAASWQKLVAVGATLVSYLSLSAAVQGVRNLLGLADASEKTRLRLAALYGGAEAGAQAFAQLRDIASRNGLEFSATADAATRLKAFGIDPLNGSLQALIDQNARLGGSQQTLEGIILAVGQAWSKQKLQGEEILQLVERGVPVWDLLAAATGKNVVELQKLSEAGKLGRAEITALIQQIGTSAQGAAAEQLGTFGGLVTQIKDRWNQFLQAIADAGVLDYAKQQLTELLDTAKRLAADGTLAQWAQSTANGIRSLAETIKGGVQFIYEYSGALIALAKAFAAIKIAQVAAEFGLWISKLAAGRAGIAALVADVGAAGTAVGGLRAGLASLPASLRLGIIAVGVELTLSQLAKVYEAYQALQEARQRLNQELVAERDANEAIRGQLTGLKELYQSYAQVAIRSSEQLQALTSAQARDYQQQLEGAQKYYRALEVEARRAGDSVALNAAREKLAEIGNALGALRERMSQIAQSGQDISASVGEFGRQMAASFIAAKEAGTDAAGSIKAAFDKLDLTSVGGLRNALDGIQAIKGLSEEAGQALEDQLRARLAKMSAEDFAKVQAAAARAFAAGSKEAAAFGRAIDGINLARLGVDLEQIQTGFSKTGSDAVKAFAGAADEVTKLGLTGAQQSAALAQAFDAAFGKVATRPELEALRAELQKAFEGGKISADEYADRLAKVQSALDKLKDSAGGNGGKPGAADSLRRVNQAAGEGEKVLNFLGKEIDKSEASFRDLNAAAQQVTVNLGRMSEGFARSAQEASATAKSAKEYIKTWNSFNAEYERQNKQYEQRRKAVEEQIASMDEEQIALARLRKEYGAISDQELQKLLDLEKQLAELRQKSADSTDKRSEAERRLRDEIQQTNASASDAPLEYSKNIRVDVNVRADASAGAGTLSEAALSQIAARVAPVVTRAVLDEIARDRRAA